MHKWLRKLCPLLIRLNSSDDSEWARMGEIGYLMERFSPVIVIALLCRRSHFVSLFHSTAGLFILPLFSFLFIWSLLLCSSPFAPRPAVLAVFSGSSLSSHKRSLIASNGDKLIPVWKKDQWGIAFAAHSAVMCMLADLIKLTINFISRIKVNDNRGRHKCRFGEKWQGGEKSVHFSVILLGLCVDSRDSSCVTHESNFGHFWASSGRAELYFRYHLSSSTTFATLFFPAISSIQTDLCLPRSSTRCPSLPLSAVL